MRRGVLLLVALAAACSDPTAAHDPDANASVPTTAAAVSEPGASERAASKPEASEGVASEPGASQGAASEPGASERAAAPADLPPSEPFGRTVVELVAPGGRAVAVPVYDAADDATRGRGLMGRGDLPDGTGMVFRFAGPNRGGFYMKDTLIPLSIAFFSDDGRVVAVLDMEPCRHDPCTIYDPGVAYAGALEVEQGFFDEVGLRRGWRISVPDHLPPAS